MSSQARPSTGQQLPQIKFGKKFWIWVIVIAVAVVMLQTRSLGEWWDLLFFEPMLNSLLLLYRLLGNNFVLSIVVFTLVIRVLTLPMTIKQMETTKKTQEMQPKLDELRKKYENDADRLNQETMKLYREMGISPTGCLGPFVIQFPIWIGLYNSVLSILSNNPIQLMRLGKHIYPFLPNLSRLVPFQSSFLWLDLGEPDPYYILPILVVATMWAQQKMMATPAGDSQQQQMNQSMQLMMPIMFGMFMYTAPAGVAMYFVVSNFLSIIQQYFTTGWGGLFPQKATAEADPTSSKAPRTSPSAKGKSDGNKRRIKKRRN